MATKSPKYVTAAEAIRILNESSEYQARRAENAKRNAQMQAIAAAEQKLIIADLRQVGVYVHDFWRYVNQGPPVEAAIPVLTKHLCQGYGFNTTDSLLRSLNHPLNSVLVIDSLKSLISTRKDEYMRDSPMMVSMILAVLAVNLTEKDIPYALEVMADPSFKECRRALMENTRKFQVDDELATRIESLDVESRLRSAYKKFKARVTRRK